MPLKKAANKRGRQAANAEKDKGVSKKRKKVATEPVTTEAGRITPDKSQEADAKFETETGGFGTDMSRKAHQKDLEKGARYIPFLCGDYIRESKTDGEELDSEDLKKLTNKEVRFGDEANKKAGVIWECQACARERSDKDYAPGASQNLQETGELQKLHRDQTRAERNLVPRGEGIRIMHFEDKFDPGRTLKSAPLRAAGEDGDAVPSGSGDVKDNFKKG